MSESIEVSEAETVTVGFIGQPGARVFYLQVWTGGRIHSLKLEKQHVAALAEAITELLADVAVEGTPHLPDILDPGVPDWIVGSMGLTSFDELTGRALLVCNELVAEEDAEDAARATIGMTPPQLAALAARCVESLAGGRPNCELCGRPKDPQGHVCPKTNGSSKH
ncbi:MAG TPA: DUF3090 family protein [Acidimicrobiales bacterium]|jgi:uncharacterized repeat protein (TIGR03847 family)|nr:DUF3090 family protein [Acidimicrobiales bacterium]